MFDGALHTMTGVVDHGKVIHALKIDVMPPKACIAEIIWATKVRTHCDESRIVQLNPDPCIPGSRGRNEPLPFQTKLLKSINAGHEDPLEFRVHAWL